MGGLAIAQSDALGRSDDVSREAWIGGLWLRGRAVLRNVRSRRASDPHSQPDPSLSESRSYGSEPVTRYVTPGSV
jgi:hypothetical protein